MPMDPIPVIDLFAGPGGMSEGFSSLRDENDEPVFRSIMSIEMERTAHATLRLRAFARRLMDADGRLPQDYIDYLGTPSSENLERLKDSHPEEWAAAEAEAIQGTLKEGDDEFVEMAKKRLQGYDGPLVLIGGPPCRCAVVTVVCTLQARKGRQADALQVLSAVHRSAQAYGVCHGERERTAVRAQLRRRCVRTYPC